MTKRKLTTEELGISTKSLTRMSEELKYNEYQLEICELKVKTGLEIEYFKQLRDYKKLRREFGAECVSLRERMHILQEQIRVGVEIKDIKPESEKEVD